MVMVKTRTAAEQCRVAIFEELQALNEAEQTLLIRRVGAMGEQFRTILQEFANCFCNEMVPGLEDFDSETLIDLQTRLIWGWYFVWNSLQEDHDKPLFVVWQRLLHYLSLELTIRLTK